MSSSQPICSVLYLSTLAGTSPTNQTQLLKYSKPPSSAVGFGIQTYLLHSKLNFIALSRALNLNPTPTRASLYGVWIQTQLLPKRIFPNPTPEVWCIYYNSFLRKISMTCLYCYAAMYCLNFFIHIKDFSDLFFKLCHVADFG